MHPFKGGSEGKAFGNSTACVSHTYYVGLHVLNEGNTPTLEVFRGHRLLKSVMDVTACSSALMDKAKEWQAVRDVISLDHNAVTFAVQVEGRFDPWPLSLSLGL
ncbi:hypothetical protein EVAR_48581_1 [Eumeta japonica]|uniref:Uncharacterized protein n=1 Tax=Eumeta variegata TaxID=151549 RepID=A0A4C1XDN0_EUMVA|nr:hypothetical protein EVAR_48581_1 [Eumeta japonica]